MVLALSFAPPVILGLLIFKYGVDLIDWDQWEIAGFFEKASRGALSISDLFAQQAEYRQFFPNLIFVGLGHLTHWNIRYEMLVSFLLASLVAFNIFHLGKLTVGNNRSRRFLLLFVSSLLVFSPAQFENWLLGEQIIYFIPVTCVTTCLLVAYSGLNQTAKLILCMLLSTVSTFSSANGIVCWLVIAPVLFFIPEQKSWRNWHVVAWVAGFLINVTLYFSNYRKPSYTPGVWEILYHPLDGVFFFCSLLGAPLVTSNRLILASAVIGAFLATLFVVTCFYTVRWTRDNLLKRKLVAWLMLGAYSFITGIIITIGRMGFGPSQSVTSRYTTFSVFLIVSLCYLVPIVLDDLREHGPIPQRSSRIARLVPFALASLVIFALLNSAIAVRQMASMKLRRLQAKACLLFVDSVPDECLSDGFPDIEIVKDRINAINNLGYLRPALIKSSRIEEIAVPVGANKGEFGRFENLSRTDGGDFNVSGWASLAGGREPADSVLLTYQAKSGPQVIFALAQMKSTQPSFISTFSRTLDSNPQWEKTFSINRVPFHTPVSISAWAFDATTGRAYKLDGSYILEGDGNSVGINGNDK
jgi:hypothetical protein